MYTFTLLYEDLDGKRLEDPDIIAFIQFGNGGLVHRLGELDLDNLEIGQQVEAVFKAKAEREGSIQDIIYFRPI